MFRGALRVVFTVVVPLALMTTYPARALLGTLALSRARSSSAARSRSPAFARFVWLRSIGHYTSASS